MKADRQFCVYSHSVNGKVVYVGKGTVERAFTSAGRNPQWHDSVKGGITIKIVRRFSSEKEALAYEAKTIGIQSPLCNIHHKGGTRTSNLMVRLTKTEKADLRRKAKRAGVSLSVFVRILIQGELIRKTT